MVDMDSGYVGVLMVSGKSPDNFAVRSSSSFVDKLRAEKTRLRYDNEPAMGLCKNCLIFQDFGTAVQCTTVNEIICKTPLLLESVRERLTRI